MKFVSNFEDSGLIRMYKDRKLKEKESNNKKDKRKPDYSEHRNKKRNWE